MIEIALPRRLGIVVPSSAGPVMEDARDGRVGVYRQPRPEFMGRADRGHVARVVERQHNRICTASRRNPTQKHGGGYTVQAQSPSGLGRIIAPPCSVREPSSNGLFVAEVGILTAFVASVGVSVVPLTVHFDFAAAVRSGSGYVPVRSPPAGPDRGPPSDGPQSTSV